MSAASHPTPPIVELVAEDAPALVALLSAASAHYLRFAPRFGEDTATFANHLENHKADRWWGFREDGRLLGFFMLRGLDEGYKRPAFGVFIAEGASNRGLGRRALEHALEWCAKNRVSRVMLKVHAENSFAREMYVRSGFRFLETCPETGQQIMEKSVLEP